MPAINRKMPLAASAAIILLASSADAVVFSRDTRETSLSRTYSFERYTQEFGKTYRKGSEEWKYRQAVFLQATQRVDGINAHNAMQGHPWKAGVNVFSVWTKTERDTLNGYKPSVRANSMPAGTISLLRGGGKTAARMNATAFDISVGGSGGILSTDGPVMRDQGNCGSCWAISAVEAIEAQLLKNGFNTAPTLSAQALIDCVPNPQHCGGTGGCDGATGELAYEYVKQYGLPLEGQYPYHARTQACEATTAARVRIGGWDQLPSNHAQPLMQALVEKGPVIIAVDANNWFDYESGIFDGCSKDAVLGHAVLAKGFGEADGNKFWLIQNSWGGGWGEKGHIRIIRHEDEDAWCGIDRKPQEGVGCDGGPSEVKVCGTCGLLYDPIVPIGVTADAAPALEESSSHVSYGSFDADDSDDLASRMEISMQSRV